MRLAIAGADGRIEKLELNRDKLRTLKAQIEAQLAEIGGEINDAYESRNDLQKQFDLAMDEA